MVLSLSPIAGNTFSCGNPEYSLYLYKQEMRNRPINSIFFLGTLLLCQSIYSQDSLVSQKQRDKMIEIEIWSDLMCPFCYIGKRKLETALQKFEFREKVRLNWKSYLLSPELVSDSTISIHEHLAKSKGWTLEYAKEMGDYVSNMAAETGLVYQMDKVKVANTFDAHRCIQFAKQKNRGNELEELFFRAYFSEGQNLADRNVLVKLANEAGLDEKEVQAILSGNDYSEEVRKEVLEAEQIGVSGVPFFVFNRKFAVSGAQPVETFLNALKKAWENK